MNAGTAAQNNPLPGTGALTADLVQSLTYGNGLVYWKNFTQDNRLYQSLVEQGATSVMNAGTSSADGVNITQAWDNLTPAETQNFTYSNAGRLASASGAYGTRAWSYDGVGNRLTETKDGVATAWTYAATSNRLLNVKQGATTLRSFVYYPDGSLNADTRGSTGYGYSMRMAGVLGAVTVAGVNQTNMTFDTFRRMRVRTLYASAGTGAVHYVWDIFGHVIAEHRPASAMFKEYAWLGDMPLAAVDATASPSKLYYVHVDHLDRPAVMTDATKAVVWKASYEPFGARPSPRQETRRSSTTVVSTIDESA